MNAPRNLRRVHLDPGVAAPQSEVAVAEHVVDGPSFDDYVVARGGDLLRTAWLLVGDDRAAQELVRSALARAWPQWSHLAHRGAGSYDTDLRRYLLQDHLRHHQPGHHQPGPRRGVDGSGSLAAQDDRPTSSSRRGRGAGLDVLDFLSHRERTVVVLVLFDGLADGQVADLLDDDVGSVRRHLLHALALLRDEFGLDERGVRGLLESLAPDDPPVELLLSREVPYPPRWRALRGWGFAVCAVAVTALVVGMVSRQPGGDADPSPGLTPPLQPAAASCRSTPGPPAPPRPVEPPLSAHYAAVLVCAQTGDGSVWGGALPPDEPVTDPAALDSLTLSPRGSGAACPDLPHGPAYRLLLLGRDGTTTTWANEGLACDGWPALAQLYVASAEQSAKTAPADGGFLGCPSALGQRLDRTGTGAGLQKGTVLVEATACLHPLAVARPGAIPRFRAVRGNVLGEPNLAELNAELTVSGSRATDVGDCAYGPWRYGIRGRTATGRVVELSSVCGREFAVDGHARDSWPVSARTTSMLRALLLAN